MVALIMVAEITFVAVRRLLDTYVRIRGDIEIRDQFELVRKCDFCLTGRYYGISHDSRIKLDIHSQCREPPWKLRGRSDTSRLTILPGR